MNSLAIISTVSCPYCNQPTGYDCMTAGGRFTRKLHQARLLASEGPICIECGNDLACEGYLLCSECLEQTT